MYIILYVQTKESRYAKIFDDRSFIFFDYDIAAGRIAAEVYLYNITAVIRVLTESCSHCD